MQTKQIVALAAMGMCGVAAGQTVQWVQLVHTDTGRNNGEVAVGVNRAGTDVTVAWIEFFDPGNGHGNPHVRYNISSDGEHFTSSAAAALPTGSSLSTSDPTVAYFRAPGYSGDALIGALNNATLDGFWSCYKPAGQGLNQAVRVAISGGVDHPMFAVGPSLDGGPDVAGAFCNRPDLVVGENRPRLRGFTSRSSPLGVWDVPDFQVGQTSPGNLGGCGAPVILHNQSVAGRWVVGYGNENGYPAATVWTGTQWVDAPAVISATIPGSQSTEEISPFGFLSGGSGAGCLQITSDPVDSRKVYLIFTATAASTGVANADLFVAQSTDGGLTFPASQVLHLTDALLGVSQRQQVLSTVTVDSFGGVNIGYYNAIAVAATNPPAWEYQFKYARIATFSASAPVVANRTFPGVGSFDLSWDGLALGWMGDYTGSDSRDCDVYLGFMSRHEGGFLSVYVAKVRACAEYTLADVNTDSAVTAADAALFTEWFSQSDPRADLNQSSAVDTTDFVLFCDSYACGCNPP
jgi:hypothetical protein